MINHKWKMILLIIVSFGLILIKWKKVKHQKNTFYQVENLPFDINKLIKYLGNNNFVAKECKLSRIELEIKDLNLVNLEKIKALKGVSGLFVKSNLISIILGVYSKATFTALAKQK
ncbi:PTS sugar transporter subunit IIABC [Mycoplasmopsis bovirhinis]|uniref:PTS sugar transporter subunit IIABC n=1 Tax=Mycoplasmopsis bovirhinis TaxID=29553 RepID=UPI000C05BBC5|nr:PTS sugar transporter subunit IIABC [Mycoplasmopsis bovirhinis]ATO30918.1 PTS sugar transporter subunit IIABC [Mycoplasmopsis bovirhinis]